MKTKLKMWIGVGAYVLTNAGFAAIAATQPSLDGDRAQQNEAIQTETLILPIANLEESGEGVEEDSTLDSIDDSTPVDDLTDSAEDPTTLDSIDEEPIDDSMDGEEPIDDSMEVPADDSTMPSEEETGDDSTLPDSGSEGGEGGEGGEG